MITAFIGAAAGACALGWLRERRRHNASIRMLARALADTASCPDSHGLLVGKDGIQENLERPAGYGWRGASLSFGERSVSTVP